MRIRLYITLRIKVPNRVGFIMINRKQVFQKKQAEILDRNDLKD